MATHDLTAARLRELFAYDGDTGVFHRLTSRGPTKPGPVTPCFDSHGYQVIRVDYKLYRAHRLAWLYMHGCWPSGDIDHIDGNRANNRAENLRDVTRSENCQNLRAAQAHSTTGILGVSKVDKSSQWRARISANGSTKHLGCFPSQEAAHAAYLAAKRGLHPAGTL